MDKSTLIQQRDALQEQFNNLSDPAWVAGQLNNLRGKYEILTSVINNLEEEENAKDQPTVGQTDSNDDQGKQTVSRKIKG